MPKEKNYPMRIGFLFSLLFILYFFISFVLPASILQKPLGLLSEFIFYPTLYFVGDTFFFFLGPESLALVLFVLPIIALTEVFMIGMFFGYLYSLLKKSA